jgi:predicted DNA-binding transcriptional regulator AlpA
MPSNTPAPTPGPQDLQPQAGGIIAELLNERDAARLLGIGCRTVWRWSRSGVCPRPRKLGNGPKASIRYSRSELLAWIASGCPRCDGGHHG